jgi:hypothetical protein
MCKVVAGALVAVAFAWAQAVGAADAPKAQSGQPSHTGTSGHSAEQPKHPLFEGKNNFDVKGKVQHASADKITIQRDDLPPVTLHVSPSTKVEVDGKKAAAGQLKQGQDVRASFNLRGEKPEAVEIKADALKADDRKEMSEQKAKAQKEMGETQREAQQQQQKSK